MARRRPKRGARVALSAHAPLVELVMDVGAQTTTTGIAAGIATGVAHAGRYAVSQIQKRRKKKRKPTKRKPTKRKATKRKPSTSRRR